MSLDRSVKRLIQVRNNVVAVFDPNAQANHLWSDACIELGFRRHLPMRG